MQFSWSVRNAQLDVLDGLALMLELRTGEAPTDCRSKDSGLLLGSVQLPVDWLWPSVGGIKTKVDNWESVKILLTGKVGHFRMKDTECRMQGSVSGKGGDGDMELDNVNVAEGQMVVVENFKLTAGNP